jgi:hypothetical protein
MREFFTDLIHVLSPLCPTFLQLPPEVPYPHMTVEEITSLCGIPAGPTLLSFSLKIWSQYAGTKEILKTLHEVENLIITYQKGRMKIMKSFLTLLSDGKTRVHTLHLKARVPYERN